MAWDGLSVREKQEVDTHSKVGGDKESFQPSEQLLDSIRKVTWAGICRIRTEKEYRKMIEANISILNGREIEKAEELFFGDLEIKGVSTFCAIYGDFTREIFLASPIPCYVNDWLSKDRKCKEVYDDILKNRHELWKNS